MYTITKIETEHTVTDKTTGQRILEVSEETPDTEGTMVRRVIRTKQDTSRVQREQCRCR